tara:strand:+ start:1231 stop:2172 length:942 start_codon:yes stop_codon:yes gene_type:complete
MTYIVTGGAGFIGSNFLHYIKNKWDNQIVVLDNLSYAADLEYVPNDRQFIFEWCDISNEDHVNYLFKKYKPKKVFHFAAESHVDRSIKNYRPFLEANVIGTINLLNASLEAEIQKFHHISTDEVYGSLEYEDTDLFKETTPYDPRNPYSASKAASDYFVTSWNNTYGLPYIITNCSNNYGPRQHVEKLIPLVVNNALSDEITFMHGGGRQIRDWLHVRDHCRALVMIDDAHIVNEKYNIGGSCEMRNLDVTKMILNYMKKPYDLIGISHDRPGIDKRYGMDHSKITTDLGWEPNIDFESGIKDTVRWYLNRLT